MARGLTLQSTQPLQRYQALGKAAGGLFRAPAEGYLGGRKMAQEENKLIAETGAADAKKKKIEAEIKEAERSKKAFQKLKERTIAELKPILKGKSLEYGESRIEAISSAEDVESLQTITKNVVGELDGHKKYSKDYPNLTFDEPSGVPGAVLRNPKYAEERTAGYQKMVDDTNTKNITARVNEIAARPEMKGATSNQVMRAYAKETTGQDDIGILNKDVQNAIESAFITESQRLSAQARRSSADRQMDLATDQTLVNIQSQQDKIRKSMAEKVKTNIRNLTDAAQYIKSKEFAALDEELKEQFKKDTERLKEFETKEKLHNAAFSLGMRNIGLTKINNVYLDLIDGDSKIAPENLKIAKEAGFPIPGEETIPAPGGEQTPPPQKQAPAPGARKPLSAFMRRK